MRQAIVLAAILLGVLVAYTLMPKPDTLLQPTDVPRFVVEDAKKTFGEEASYQILRSEKKNGKWEVDLKIAVAPHSKCPKLLRRAYVFPPPYFREEVLNDACRWPVFIAYDEEALLATLKLQKVQRLPETATGYVTRYTAEEVQALQQCVSCSPLQEFAKQLQPAELWIVEWRNDTESFFVAVDKNGDLVANT